MGKRIGWLVDVVSIEKGGSVAGAPGAPTVAAWGLGGARDLSAPGVATLDAGPRSTHAGHRELPPLRAGSRQAGDGHSACLNGGGEFGRGHRLVVDVVSMAPLGGVWGSPRPPP